MFRQKFLVVMSLSAFFKGSEKVESLKWEYEWFETYLNCNNIYIWKTNQKNHFCNSNQKSKTQYSLGQEGYVKKQTQNKTDSLAH